MTNKEKVFDIFRFDAEGKVADHLDNLADKAKPNPSGHTQVDGYMANEYHELQMVFQVLVQQRKHGRIYMK